MQFLGDRPMSNLYPTNDSYILIPNRRVIAYSAKAGSTSIGRALSQYRKMPQAQAMDWRKRGLPVVLFMRHPYERLVSAWWMFSTGARGHSRRFPTAFEDFVRKALHGKPDKEAYHWAPQTDYHTYNGTFLPTEVYPFDRISTLWPFLGTNTRIQQLNAGRDRPSWKPLVNALPEDLQLGLTNYYSADMIHYNGSVAELADASDLESDA